MFGCLPVVIALALAGGTGHHPVPTPEAHQLGARPTSAQTRAAQKRQPSTPRGPRSAEAIARAHLAAEGLAAGLTADDLAGLVLSSQHTSGHSGVTHVYLRQTHHGIDIEGAAATVNVSARGTVISAPHTLVARVALAVNTAAASLGPVEAVVAAARHLGLAHVPPVLVSTADTPGRESLVRAPELAAEPVPARLVFHVAAPTRLRLAWQVDIERPDGSHWWVVTVDAVTGEVLAALDRVVDGSPPAGGPTPPSHAGG